MVAKDSLNIEIQTAIISLKTVGGTMDVFDLVSEILYADGFRAAVAGLIGIGLIWLTWSGLKRRHRSEDRVDAILLQVLNHPKYPKRHFGRFRRRVGLRDEALREALLRVGAVRFEKHGTREELWGLASRNQRDID